MRTMLLRRRVATICVFVVLGLVLATIALVTRTAAGGASPSPDSASRSINSASRPTTSASRPTTSASRSTPAATAARTSSSLPSPTTSDEVVAASAAGQSEAPAATGSVTAEEAASLDPNLVDLAACGLTGTAIEALLGPEDFPSSADDRLRDAIHVLQDNLVVWQQAVEARPELAPALSSAQKVLVFWETALTAFDEGDQEAADAALAASRAELEANARQSRPSDSCGS